MDISGIHKPGCDFNLRSGEWLTPLRAALSLAIDLNERLEEKVESLFWLKVSSVALSQEFVVFFDECVDSCDCHSVIRVFVFKIPFLFCVILRRYELLARIVKLALKVL